MITDRHPFTRLAAPLGGPVVARLPRHQGVKLHVLIAGLYAVTIWLSLLAYTALVGLPSLAVLILGPVIISGLIVILLVLDLALDPLWPILARRWAWLSAATVRLCRRILPPRRSKGA